MPPCEICGQETCGHSGPGLCELCGHLVSPPDDPGAVVDASGRTWHHGCLMSWDADGDAS
jgi:hypothetical protein